MEEIKYQFTDIVKNGGELQLGKPYTINFRSGHTNYSFKGSNLDRETVAELISLGAVEEKKKAVPRVIELFKKFSEETKISFDSISLLEKTYPSQYLALALRLYSEYFERNSNVPFHSLSHVYALDTLSGDELCFPTYAIYDKRRVSYFRSKEELKAAVRGVQSTYNRLYGSN